MNADITGMVHANDPETSHEAAAGISRRLTALHAKVILAFERWGVLTDEELEQLVEFAHYGPSTIRKRRSELYQAGRLVKAGDTRNSRGQKMIRWKLREAA